MIKKFTLGKPYDTGAVVRETAASGWDGFPYKYTQDEGFSFEIPLGGEDIVYGLGETTRGINKRGWIYANRTPAFSLTFRQEFAGTSATQRLIPRGLSLKELTLTSTSSRAAVREKLSANSAH